MATDAKPGAGQAGEIELPNIRRCRVRGPYGVGGCNSRGHINVHGDPDHEEVYEIEFSSITVRACAQCAHSILEQLRRFQ